MFLLSPLGGSHSRLVIVVAVLWATAVSSAPTQLIGAPSSSPSFLSSSSSSSSTPSASSSRQNVFLEELLSSLLLPAAERDAPISSLDDATQKLQQQQQQQQQRQHTGGEGENSMEVDDGEASWTVTRGGDVVDINEMSDAASSSSLSPSARQRALIRRRLSDLLVKYASSAPMAPSLLGERGNEILSDPVADAAEVLLASTAAPVPRQLLQRVPTPELLRALLYRRRGRRSTADQKLADMIFRIRLMKEQGDAFGGEGGLGGGGMMMMI